MFSLGYNSLMMKKYLSQFGTVVGIITILVSLIGCAQTRALNKLERLILDDDEFHSHAKSNAISCIDSIDYERNHEEIVNIIFNSGNLDLIDQFVEYFPADYRNYIIRGDALLKNAMMQQIVGIFMKSSVTVSVNKAKESYLKALELNNRDIYALGVLSFLYGEEKEYDKAEELLNRGLEFAPNNPLLYMALGQMYDRKKEYHIAIDYYEKVLGFTEDEVEKEFEHMKQYYHKLMDFYPDSLAKVKEEAKKYLKEDYKKTRRETIL
jgi:tetratricopeptide (TPR) repeat protein